MPNDYENPKYTNKNEYHAGDGPFQFPWWAIVIAFVVWWPLGLVFIGLNAAMKNGRLGGFEQKAREATRDRTASGVKPVYTAEFRPIYDAPDQPQPKAAAPMRLRSRRRYGRRAKAQGRGAGHRPDGGGRAAAYLRAGGAAQRHLLAARGPDGGRQLWTWLVEDSMPMLMSLTGGIGCLFGANHIRTTRRMRKKIDNIVGDAKYMYIQDIADAIPCSYEKCCKHLENCIDEGLFGPGAYLDMHRKCLVVKERPPEPTPAPAPAPKPQKADPMPEADQYQKILDELRRVNDAIPDEEMTDKISRLEAVSAKIFEQARTDPDKLPQMRKFMDYYLPTSLKLLNTYAELDKQGIEGENISESKHRIEQTMDTLVKAFENQLDRLFASDALDVSTDIDVMQNMLRADGLTDDAPFKL
ncbi:5-bromo-4-chloroindolyl phosphate hydrolysis family protein [Gemmiger formicilis]|nr:5-bromo-4-chloroindolyl phosphate hydrolysis family protein [Gemmiger formicilis]